MNQPSGSPVKYLHISVVVITSGRCLMSTMIGGPAAITSLSGRTTCRPPSKLSTMPERRGCNHNDFHKVPLEVPQL